MSSRETDSSDGRPENPVEGGVLAALPRTRPQRASPRRAAARKRADKAQSETAGAKPSKTTSPKRARELAQPQVKAQPKVKAKASKTKANKTKASKTKASKTRPALAKKPTGPPGGRAPSQGYEPEEEVELGKTVNPPSGIELVESVADIFGELANSSLAAGGRILKDAFSLLRRP